MPKACTFDFVVEVPLRRLQNSNHNNMMMTTAACGGLGLYDTLRRIQATCPGIDGSCELRDTAGVARPQSKWRGSKQDIFVITNQS